MRELETENAVKEQRYDVCIASCGELASGIIDVDGIVSKGVIFLGNAYRNPDGTWTCLANVDGTLARVEVNLSCGDLKPAFAEGHFVEPCMNGAADITIVNSVTVRYSATLMRWFVLGYS